MKSERQGRIIELISKYEIETQEEMMTYLQNEGFKVTQATVSRDLKELKLTKTLTARGTYRYAVSNPARHRGNLKLNHAMVDSIVHIDYAMNNVIIKTYPGLANAVAVGIDSMNLQQILGCVAGDDTIMVVSRDEECAKNLADRFHDLMKFG